MEELFSGRLVNPYSAEDSETSCMGGNMQIAATDREIETIIEDIKR